MNFLFLDFINSGELDYLTGKPQEHLLEDGWLENLLKKYQLMLPTALDQPVLEMLVDFRQKFRAITEKIIAGEDLRESDVVLLNQYLARSNLTRQIEYATGEYKFKLIPNNYNWDWIFSEVITSLIVFIRAQDVTRLKICENDNCRWLFYDESKSHTRRYCSDSSCGNLLKVRRFRERQKEAKSSTAN